jgi:hypothetical protein
MTTFLQRISAFLEDYGQGRYSEYRDLISRQAISGDSK